MPERKIAPVYRDEIIMPAQGGHAHAPITIERAPRAGEVMHDVEHTEVEETLSLEEKEKELIKKALVKHRGRRKGAASELGISERTLYRKIKEYDIK